MNNPITIGIMRRNGIMERIFASVGALRKQPPTWLNDLEVVSMETIRVPLSSRKYPGLVALIDEEDLPMVSGYRWYAIRHSSYKNEDVWYVRAKVKCADVGGGQIGTVIHMHRLILGFPMGMVDHKNGNPLDNRRSNLRICSNSQNQANRRRLATNTSGFRGVTWNKKSRRWQASIMFNQKCTYLGMYDLAEDAAIAYDVKARELFGEFASLNFPSETEEAA